LFGSSILARTSVVLIDAPRNELLSRCVVVTSEASVRGELLNDDDDPLGRQPVVPEFLNRIANAASQLIELEGIRRSRRGGN